MVTEDHKAVFIVIYTKLDILVDPEVLITEIRDGSKLIIRSLKARISKGDLYLLRRLARMSQSNLNLSS